MLANLKRARVCLGVGAQLALDGMCAILRTGVAERSSRPLISGTPASVFEGLSLLFSGLVEAFADLRQSNFAVWRPDVHCVYYLRGCGVNDAVNHLVRARAFNPG